MPSDIVYAAARQMTKELLAFIVSAGDAALAALEHGAQDLDHREAAARAVQAIFAAPYGERLEAMLRELRDAVVTVAVQAAVSQYRGGAGAPEPLRGGMADEFRAAGFPVPADVTSGGVSLADAVAGPLAEFVGAAQQLVKQDLVAPGKLRPLAVATRAGHALRRARPDDVARLDLLLSELRTALETVAANLAVAEYLRGAGAGTEQVPPILLSLPPQPTGGSPTLAPLGFPRQPAPVIHIAAPQPQHFSIQMPASPAPVVQYTPPAQEVAPVHVHNEIHVPAAPPTPVHVSPAPVHVHPPAAAPPVIQLPEAKLVDLVIERDKYTGLMSRVKEEPKE